MLIIGPEEKEKEGSIGPQRRKKPRRKKRKQLEEGRYLALEGE